MVGLASAFEKEPVDSW